VRSKNAANVAVAGLLTLLAGCGVTSPPAGTSLPSQSVTARAVVSPKVVPLAGPSGKFVYFAAAGGPNQVLVAVGWAAGSLPGVQLLAATAAGTDVRDIGPRVPGNELPDSVFFLDRQHGWFATYSVVRGETLYRTADGGRSWQAFPAPNHVLASLGTTDAVQFLTPDVGWLADIEPSGPTETLYHTTDGGASWQPVAVLNQALPRLGVVEFEPGDAVGWLAGLQYYSGQLDVTADQGRDWQAAALPVSQAGSVVGLPAIFGATLIEPVVDCSADITALRTYLSSDNGARWSLTSTANIAPGCQPVSTAFPSETAGWAAALRSRRVVVERTTDHGGHWIAVETPRLTTSYPPEIVAPDASHAWLLVPGVGGAGTRVYVTDDAGKTWQRIDQKFTR
jgi:photosystem II stability/assembly factor-like uncharacterized protein